MDHVAEDVRVATAELMNNLFNRNRLLKDLKD
jgi:hypothetical protein